MMHGVNGVPLQSFRDVARLVSATSPALRWRREPGATRTLLNLFITNESAHVAAFKFQTSAAADASQDNVALITVPEDSDPATSPNFVMFYNQIGMFNASFADVAVTVNGSSVTAGTPITVVPNGQINVQVDTMNPFIQIQATTANAARILISGTSSQKMTLFSNQEVTRASTADTVPPGYSALQPPATVVNVETDNLSSAPNDSSFAVLDTAPGDA